MSSVVYFVRAPRYADLSIEKIRLIELYLQWRHHCKAGSQYAATTFEKWCGRSLKELPPMEAIKHFVPYFERDRIDDEDDINGYKCYGIFEQVGRFSKASQFYGWVLKNVLNNVEDAKRTSSIELSKNQVEDLLEACNHVRRYAFKVTGSDIRGNKCRSYEYKVDESIAREILPIMDLDESLLFPYAYDMNYARQVISAVKVLNEIVLTTDFDKQTIYFQR